MCERWVVGEEERALVRGLLFVVTMLLLSLVYVKVLYGGGASCC